MALLEITDLHTTFATREGMVRAVDGVSMTVEAGETVGVVGESGCGKSVTALSIMRLVGPPGNIDSGEIVFEGEDMTTLAAERMRSIRGRKISMVFQDPMTSLNPSMTIGSQISEPIRVHLGLDTTKARERTLELLALVGIPSPEDRYDDYPHQFSGGMRQRVMIAMALACNPRLVLADEVTTALDVTIQAQILDLLRRITRDSETAYVLITHDLGVVAGMTQRVFVMYAGQVVEQATTDSLFTNPQMPYTWGLLRSIPRIDRERSEMLTPIEGMPPDLIDPPAGCRFAPRCSYRREICTSESPTLDWVGSPSEGHKARCWGTQASDGGGWLIGHDWRSEADQPPTGTAIPPDHTTEF